MATQVGQVQALARYPVKSMAGEALERAQVAAQGLLGDRAYALRDDEVGELRGAKKWPQLMLCRARYVREPSPSATPAASITLPDGSETHTDDPNVSARLSALLGVKVTLFPLLPASNKAHYRRARPGSAAIGLLARSTRARKVVAQLAKYGANGAELRADFAREPGEPLPDLSVFAPDLFEYTSPPGTYFDAFPLHLITTASLATMRARHPDGDWDARRFRANVLVDSALAGLPEAEWAGRTLRIGALELACTIPTPRCGMVAQAQPGLARDPRVLRAIVRDAAQNFGIYARVTRPGAIAVGDAVELL